MLRSLLTATAVTLATTGAVMAQDRIRISSGWGEVTAVLADNAAARELSAMLPLTIGMSDHLRQEKTGRLPSALPELPRQRDFSVGTLGLWGGRDFVVYYRSGRVPSPGIIVLGQVEGDVSIFDRPGDVTVDVTRVD
ncbi:MAG: cyclophilin-like fold protein [Aquamicrobium sp.]|uniref:cyclophilin-like fold protein n=1 Tax=Aquamicrobium sp. TaxID=1872579 RepID=UPI00349E5823|nr:cyclophilin-like fold protein [Aquamicrobium sp.]